MSVEAFGFIVKHLEQLITYNANLILEVKDKVGSLYEELRELNALLIDARNKASDYEIVKESIRVIRDLGFEIEDAIDKYVVVAASHKARSRSRRALHVKHPLKLRNAASTIETMKSKLYDSRIQKIIKNFRNLNYVKEGGVHVGESSTNTTTRTASPQEVVDFHDKEVKMLVHRLTGALEELEVISVVGMGGTGKTTLATEVLASISPQVFHPCALIHVSQKCNTKDVFLQILSLVTPLTVEMHSMNAAMLVPLLNTHLQNERYLIVLDDVWTKTDWENLIIAFPRNKKGSRIMLTSRNTDVANLANPYSPPHHLRFLENDECWDLLCRKVFRQKSCPFNHLEGFGQEIAKKCQGLPLAVEVISGSLLNGDVNCWKRVAENFSWYIAKEPERCMDKLALSYNTLSHHLKICFFFFGVFPPDVIIDKWKLIRLWVAEGLIEQLDQGSLELEDRVDEYLDELVTKNLLIVEEKRSIDGRIKSCSIHNILRDFCLREAAKEMFLQEIIKHEQNEQRNYHRRLLICSTALNFISSQLPVTNVRSFFCFARDHEWVLPQENNTSFISKQMKKMKMKMAVALQDSESPPEQKSYFFQAFELLRVFDMSLGLTGFPSEMINLVHLRYLALSGNISLLPASISSLLNLQTLIVETTSKALDVHPNIWKLIQLTYIRTSSPSHFHNPPAKARKKNQQPRGLQTLSMLSPDSCTEHILKKALQVKKLGICGKLVTLLEENEGRSMFDNLTQLARLETLKLLNDQDFDILPCLPPKDKFPPNLRKLTLSNTSLDWKHMTHLESLPYLEVLKLRDNAFVGDSWKLCDGGFVRLRILQLVKINLVTWEASDCHFPSLQCLILKQCEPFGDIPSALGDLSSLQMLKLYHSSSAAASARLIHQRQQQKENGFKLDIDPPILY